MKKEVVQLITLMFVQELLLKVTAVLSVHRSTAF